MKKFRTLPQKSKKAILIKYMLLQIPETAVIIIVLVILIKFSSISVWLAICLAALWIIKDIIMFPLLWPSYGGTNIKDWHSLIGKEGIVTERCDPQGYVVVHGESWKAQVQDQLSPVDKGSRIQVTGSKGLILYVKPKKIDN